MRHEPKKTVYTAEGETPGCFRVVTLCGDVLMAGLTGETGAAHWGKSAGHVVLSSEEISALAAGEKELRGGILQKVE